MEEDFRKSYYEGGSAKARYLADIEILAALVFNRRPVTGFFLFLIARIFGAPIWPHKRRWGNRLPYWQSFTYRQQIAFIRRNRLPRGQEKALLRKHGFLPPRTPVDGAKASGGRND